MGIFTDIAATLSYNFGDSKKLPDEYYDHLYERDRTEEQKKLLKYLRDKFDINCKVVEDIINTINKYTNDYDNIPYDKIMHETGYQKDDLIMGEQAIKEYLAQNENIDYAINNITQPDGTSTRTDILADMLTLVAKIMETDAEFMNKVDAVSDSLDSSQSDEECAAKQLILDLVNNHPETYDQLTEIIKSSPNVTQPFTVNSDQQSQNKPKEMNEIAMGLIIDPETNAGVTPEAVEQAKQIMHQNQQKDTDSASEPQQSEGEGFTMTDPQPQEDGEDSDK